MSSEISFTLASRKSPLAICQAEFVRAKLAAALSVNRNNLNDRFLIKTFVTEGDRRLSGSLAEIGGKGLFTKEVERALLNGDADIAVHSMKDMPAVMPEGLMIAAIPAREDFRDAFLSPFAASPDDLPRHAVVGTSSVRRKAQLLHRRPDLEIKTFRGNVGSRLEKLHSGEVDATLLAEAGLQRLDSKDVKRTVLDPEIMLPAVGQGVLCVQMRSDDPGAAEIAEVLNCKVTALASTAERAFLTHLDGSCQTPIAGLAQVNGDTLSFSAQLLSLDGATEISLRDEISLAALSGYAQLDRATQFGTAMAREIYQAAAPDIKKLIRPA